MLKNIPSLVVYHVTPAENVMNIHDKGLLPSLAKGKMQAVWFVSRQHIQWAIIHCSNNHSTLPEDLAVCAVLVDGKDLYRFNRPGFYYSRHIHKIESATPAMFFLHQCGLGEIENE